MAGCTLWPHAQDTEAIQLKLSPKHLAFPARDQAFVLIIPTVFERVMLFPQLDTYSLKSKRNYQSGCLKWHNAEFICSTQCCSAVLPTPWVWHLLKTGTSEPQLLLCVLLASLCP